MKTRSGTVLCPYKMPKSKRPKVMNRKRGSSSIWPSYDADGPAKKKLKLPKTVHFETGALCAERSMRPKRYRTSTSRPLKWHQHLLSDQQKNSMTNMNDKDGEWVPGSDEIEVLEREEVEVPQIPEASNSRRNKHQGMFEIFARSTANESNGQVSSDIEYGQRYRALKQIAWRWAKTYFSTKGRSAKRPIDLLKLCRDSPRLMEFANYISACGEEPWEYVFHEQRHFLVFGILGKMLDVHVFGHEMFGATEEQLKGLRETDGQLSMEDGLSRQEERFHQVCTFFGRSPKDKISPITTLPSNIIPDLSTLQASFMHMLSPLLISTPPPADYSQSLTKILSSAATLSLRARCSPHALYNFHIHPAIGSLYSSQDMHIVNRAADAEGDFWREATDVQVVTMTGWPSLVAYGPHVNRNRGIGRSGKNQAEPEQREFMRVLARAEVVVTWGEHVKPLEVQPTNWLGPSLRKEMSNRLDRKEREERAAILGSGLAVGIQLAMGWIFQQPWVIAKAKELVGVQD